MGMIIAKFRKKKSNGELLEKIDNQIKSIENFQRNTEQQRKKIVGQFLVGSVGIYIMSAVMFYFYFYPQNFKERLLYIVPFVLAPTFIFLMKRALSWYFNQKISKNQNKIVVLRTEKKKLLENIMETETYKVARSILEKYAPEQVRKVNISQELTPIKPSGPLMSPSNNAGLRNRVLPGSRLSLRPSGMQTPSVYMRQGASQMSTNLGIGTPGQPGRTMMPMTPNNQVVMTSTATPAQIYIPPKHKTFLDKMVDYLIGDGPNNRYALICKQCSGHNGMALMDEFEYVSFKCCYCSVLNPARKRRPTAPKLELDSSELPLFVASADTSESEKNSGSDSETGDLRATPTLETLYKKEVASKAVGNDEAVASSDNEPNDFDKLSDLENRESEVEAKGDSETIPTTTVGQTL